MRRAVNGTDLTTIHDNWFVSAKRSTSLSSCNALESHTINKGTLYLLHSCSIDILSPLLAPWDKSRQTWVWRGLTKEYSRGVTNLVGIELVLFNSHSRYLAGYRELPDPTITSCFPSNSSWISPNVLNPDVSNAALRILLIDL